MIVINVDIPKWWHLQSIYIFEMMDFDHYHGTREPTSKKLHKTTTTTTQLFSVNMSVQKSWDMARKRKPIWYCDVDEFVWYDQCWPHIINHFFQCNLQPTHRQTYQSLDGKTNCTYLPMMVYLLSVLTSTLLYPWALADLRALAAACQRGTNGQIFEVMYQTPAQVFDHVSKHRERKLKNEGFLTKVRGVWKHDQTLVRVFDTTSQTNTYFRRNWRKFG